MSEWAGKTQHYNDVHADETGVVDQALEDDEHEPSCESKFPVQLQDEARKRTEEARSWAIQTLVSGRHSFSVVAEGAALCATSEFQGFQVAVFEEEAARGPRSFSLLTRRHSNSRIRAEELLLAGT